MLTVGSTREFARRPLAREFDFQPHLRGGGKSFEREAEGPLTSTYLKTVAVQRLGEHFDIIIVKLDLAALPLEGGGARRVYRRKRKSKNCDRRPFLKRYGTLKSGYFHASGWRVRLHSPPSPSPNPLANRSIVALPTSSNIIHVKLAPFCTVTLQDISF